MRKTFTTKKKRAYKPGSSAPFVLFVANLLKKPLRIALCLCALSPLPLLAANRPIVKTWHIGNGSDRLMKINFFQAEGVDFTLTSTDGAGLFALTTNDIAVWEITGWADYTNVYTACTGTVDTALSTTTFNLAPAASSLDPGTYRGFVKAMTATGENVTTRAVLAWQKIKVTWSPSSADYPQVEPIPSDYASAAQLSAYASDLDALQTGVVYQVEMVSDWYFPDWFDWSFSQVPDGIPDSSSTVTINDLVLDREVYDSEAGSFDITFSDFKSSDFIEPTLSTDDASIATADVSRVHYVSTGTVSVTATVGEFSRNETLEMEILNSTTSDVPVSAVSGTAVAAMAPLFDSRLTDGTDKAVYSTYDHTTPSYIRDATCWAGDLDLTCISPWNSTGGRTRAGVLIGSDTILFANHYPIGVGATVRFVAADNTLISRTLSGRGRVGTTDFMVGKLSAEISTNDILRAVLLPSTQYDYMPYAYSYAEMRPLLWVDQYENAYCNQSTTVGCNATICSSTNAVRSLYNKTPVVGDSGSAMFLLTGAADPLIVIGTLHTSMGGPSVSRYNTDIRATATALGCDTDSIVDADFESLGFTNFNPLPPTP